MGTIIALSIAFASTTIWVIIFFCINREYKKIHTHFHVYEKPIVSQYVSFNTRDIVYECRCGERKIIRNYENQDRPFPIPITPHISFKELEKIASQNNNKK